MEILSIIFASFVSVAAIHLAVAYELILSLSAAAGGALVPAVATAGAVCHGLFAITFMWQTAFGAAAAPTCRSICLLMMIISAGLACVLGFGWDQFLAWDRVGDIFESPLGHPLAVLARVAGWVWLAVFITMMIISFLAPRDARPAASHARPAAAPTRPTSRDDDDDVAMLMA